MRPWRPRTPDAPDWLGDRGFQANISLRRGRFALAEFQNAGGFS